MTTTHLAPSTANVFAQADPASYTALLALVRQLSLKYGHFVLASGQTSTVYLDMRLTLMHPEGARLAGRVIAQALHQLSPNPNAVGGMAVGAVPLVSSTLCAWANQGHSQPLAGFFVRKQAKAHGRQQAIEGNLQPYHTVALLEDVATTGGSTLQALATLRQAHPALKVPYVITLVDRQAGATEAFAAEGVAMLSLFTMAQLLEA